MKAVKTIGFWKAARFVWYGWYCWLIRVSLPPFRVALLRLAGATVGKDTVIMDARYTNVYHYGFSRLIIGDRCFIADEVMFDTRGGITLDDDVTLSGRVSLITHINVGFPKHPLQKQYPTKELNVMIRSGSYIGTGAIVLPGVTVGEQSVVGAGAVVTKNIPAHVVAVGVPAKVLKKIHQR